MDAPFTNQRMEIQSIKASPEGRTLFGFLLLTFNFILLQIIGPVAQLVRAVDSSQMVRSYRKI